MLFFLIFLIIPLIEITLFVTIGDEIGVFSTLLLCVLTALIGSALVRKQGLDTITSARQSLDKNELPVDTLFTGVCLIISGLLLITPGFFTDIVGFSLLVPQIREKLKSRLKDNVKVQGKKVHYGSHNKYEEPKQPAANDIIEGDYERIDDDKP